MRTKKITLCGILTALAIVLSIVEKTFPLDTLIPIPGIKLGLANVVTLFALSEMSIKEALAIVIARVTLVSVLIGSVTGFVFSLFGGLCAMIVMWIFLKLEHRFCTFLGISVAGAAAHNIGQIATAVLWMKTSAVIAYLPALLIMSVPLGLVTGFTAWTILRHMRKIQTKHE